MVVNSNLPVLLPCSSKTGLDVSLPPDDSKALVALVISSSSSIFKLPAGPPTKPPLALICA